MNDREVNLYLERLPVLLDHISSSIEEIPGMRAAALDELRTALGVALAAAERLRAERRMSRTLVH